MEHFAAAPLTLRFIVLDRSLVEYSRAFSW